MRRIDGEEAWASNPRRHERGHRNFVAEEIDKGGRERRNTRYGILKELGARGLDTHYSEAFKTTGFVFRIIIGSDEAATHCAIHNMGQGNNIVGPMSDWAELGFVTTTLPCELSIVLIGYFSTGRTMAIGRS